MVRTVAWLRDAVATHWRRLVAALLLIGSAVAIIQSNELHAAVNEAFASARGVIASHPVAGVAVFVVLAALSAMVAFFSSAILVPVGVLAWGSASTCLLLWAGWLAGGVAAYAMGRWLGRPVVRWVLRGDRLHRYEQTLRRDAPFVALVLFQMALPSEVPGYLVGVLRYPFRRYLAALAVAELPFALGAVLLGRSFIDGDYLRLVAVGGLGVVLAVSAAVAWHRRARLRSA